MEKDICSLKDVIYLIIRFLAVIKTLFTFFNISENKQKLVEFTDFYILHSWGPDKVDEMSNFETMINIYIFLKYQYLQ